MSPTLDAQLRAAHGADSKHRLMCLYEQAADQADTLDAACFYLTQAYVFALDLGHRDAPRLHARLAEHRRV